MIRRRTRTIAAVVLTAVLWTGCASHQAARLNDDIADYNRRVVAFQQDYRAAMTDLTYLRRAPGFNSLLTKAVNDAGRRKAAGTPFQSLEEAEAALWPSLTDDERGAAPGAKAWILRTAGIFRTGQALAAERVDLEQRRGAVAVSAMRHQEISRGLDAALSTLGTLAVIYAVTKPTSCVGTSTAVGVTTTGVMTCR